MNLPERIKILINYFNLDTELDDFEKVHESIVKEIVFKGTNLWILIFAIVVASVGLNMNSTAVIIGAMLISPLMGPINGMGYSIATYNFPLFRQSVKNFSFAVVTSLAASTTYFALSPISTAHSELLARTSPTIYDVLIALFGGLAGIIAINSKQKGNVIPGVAIATALMPPLCTAGYGLATAQFAYFFGALYLFTINTVFIALSSIAISQILKFPIRTIVVEAEKKRVNGYITLVIILVAIPSIYFGYQLVQKEKFNENAGLYISNISIFEGNYLLKSEINPETRSITLIYGGLTMDENRKVRIMEKAKDFSIHDASIMIKEGLTFESIDSKNAELEAVRAELNKLQVLLKERDHRIDSLKFVPLMGKELFMEIRPIFPQITGCTYAESVNFSDEMIIGQVTRIVVFNLIESSLPPQDQKKIMQWLKSRLKSDNIQVFYR
jgi:uncharacterized hydrophobic protein (TIGR00271 family)